MRRRKLLISIGALGAGGTAAFGTEAFTSVEAERSVDVTVAGDESAFLAIQPLSGNNANDYVTTESDDTVALNFDGDDKTSGSGVNQDAVTQVEDLFKIINQGTQPTSVFFEDDSDAVTFRVTRSTDTSTEGQGGQSLEGEDNSVELNTGEQVAVGITVDTLTNQVSGELITDVTIRADAGASAREQNIPQPQYVVDGEGSGPNTFDTISTAVTNADPGSVIGIKPQAEQTLSVTEQSIDKELTITGFEGTPLIDGGSPGQGGAIQVNSDNVTLKNFDLEYDGTGANQGIYVGRDTGRNGIIIDGVSVKNTGTAEQGVAAIQLNANDSEITNSIADGGAISIGSQQGSSQTTIVGNKSKNAPKEGIFAFNDPIENSDFTFKNNAVENHDQEGQDVRQVKFGTATPSSINGATGKQEQLESLLTENDINSANVTGSFGTKATGSAFSSLQSAVDTAVTTSKGVTLVEAQQSGSYSAFSIPSDNTDAKDDFLLKATGTERPVISGKTEILSASAGTRPDDVTVEGLRFEGPSSGSALDVETGVAGRAHDNLTFRDNVFVASDLGVFANNIKNSTFDNNLFTVAENNTARELLVLGLRLADDKNGDSVGVTNNDFQTPGDTSLSRGGQGGNALEFGPDTGSITGNSFNVDTDEGIKVLIGTNNTDLSASGVAGSNTGVSEDQVKEN